MHYITEETLYECAKVYQKEYKINPFFVAVERAAWDLDIDKSLLFTLVNSFNVNTKKFMVFKMKHGVEGNAISWNKPDQLTMDLSYKV